MASNDYVSDAESRKTKRNNKAPCMYIAWSDHYHKDMEFYPAVNCSYECDRCGWNPAVAKDRIARGLHLIKRKDVTK